LTPLTILSYYLARRNRHDLAHLLFQENGSDDVIETMNEVYSS